MLRLFFQLLSRAKQLHRSKSSNGKSGLNNVLYIKELNNGGDFVGRETEGQAKGDGYRSKIRDAGGSGVFGDINLHRSKIRAIKRQFVQQPEGGDDQQFATRDDRGRRAAVRPDLEGASRTGAVQRRVSRKEAGFVQRIIEQRSADPAAGVTPPPACQTRSGSFNLGHPGEPWRGNITR